MKLYHATYKPRLRSIFQFGLGAKSKKNWEDSKKGVVYLADDPDEAESYAEVAEFVPGEYLDLIVILEVDSNTLDPDLLFNDENVIDGNSTYEYHGIIAPEDLKIFK